MHTIFSTYHSGGHGSASRSCAAVVLPTMTSQRTTGVEYRMVMLSAHSAIYLSVLSICQFHRLLCALIPRSLGSIYSLFILFFHYTFMHAVLNPVFLVLLSIICINTIMHVCRYLSIIAFFDIGRQGQRVTSDLSLILPPCT